MKASGNFVQIEVKEVKSKGSFRETGNNLTEGKVVSFGEEVNVAIGKEGREPLQRVKVGTKVLFDTNKALQYSIEGEMYYFLDYKTILAKS